MKYLAVGLLVAAVVAGAGIILAGAVALYGFIYRDPGLWWVPALLVVALLAGVVAASADYLTDRPKEDQQ